MLISLGLNSLPGSCEHDKGTRVDKENGLKLVDDVKIPRAFLSMLSKIDQLITQMKSFVEKQLTKDIL